jgi:hypothetical protein
VDPAQGGEGAAFGATVAVAGSAPAGAGTPIATTSTSSADAPMFRRCIYASDVVPARGLMLATV